MQSLKDLMARMRAEMAKTHKGGVNEKGETRRETLERKWGRALCPECQAHNHNENCNTCHGSSMVCPGCRGAKRVAQQSHPVTIVNDKGEKTVDENNTKTIGYIDCPACCENGTFSFQKQQTAIQQYLVRMGSNFGNFGPAPMKKEMPGSLDSKGYWNTPVPEKPESKQGWRKYMKLPEPDAEDEAEEETMLLEEIDGPNLRTRA